MNTIRFAKSTDALPILNIYAPYILNTSITFETVVPTVEAFQQRIISYLQTWPWLVYEVDGVIAGYAYATRYRERVAYQWSTESSVYIHDSYQKRGIAKALYKALFSILKYQGCRNVYAVINLPNDRSVHFHESLGFTWFANYEKVGYKLGQWKTVGWWQLHLNDFSINPAPPLQLSEIDTSIFNLENI